jgi:hypothetical protein
MRHIPIENFKSDPDWEARAANATKELINCKTSNERKEYINFVNSTLRLSVQSVGSLM